MGLFSFNRDKHENAESKNETLVEQPLNYWEEYSYLMAIPRSGRIEVSSLHDRVAAIQGVEVIDFKSPDDEEPGRLTLNYQGETYQAGFFEGEFSLPEMLNNQGYYFTDEEMEAIRISDTALTIFMKFSSDSKQSYHLQLKLAVAMIPDLLAIMDESAERLVSARWATLATESAVLPGSNALFTVQAIAGDPDNQVWLHTHGLNRCGLYELEILNTDTENYNNHYNIIATLASYMLDHESELPSQGEGICIGMLNDRRPIVATYISWTKALKEYPGLELGGAADRQEAHNGRTAPVFLYFCENDEQHGILHKVSEYDNLWDKNPLFFIGTKETIRMSALARERFGLVKYMSQHNCEIIVKMGLKTDSNAQDDDKEHIWFKLITFDGDRFKAKLLQEPYDISSLHEGDEGWYTINDVTDWKIYLDDFSVVPDTAYLLV